MRASVHYLTAELDPVERGRSGSTLPCVLVRPARLALTLSGLLLIGACQKQEPTASETAPGARSGAPESSAAPKPAPPAKPWYVGAWSGIYTAEKHTITMSAAEGALREWSQEAGKEGIGPGDLSVEVAEDGSALGTASGSLGKMLVTGKVEDEVLTLQLKPTEAGVQSYHGFVIAKRDAQSFTGKLQASSGDGTRVRTGTVRLSPRSSDALPSSPGLGG